MNVSADAGARQVRPNVAAATATTSSTSSTAPKAQPASDSFQAAKVKSAPVSLDPSAPAQSGNAGKANPPIEVDRQKNAQYQHVDGVPFIQGSGDSNAIHWNDIHQQDLGDCYFMSAMGEVAMQNPDAIKNAIKDNGDGSYTVRFYEKKGDGPFGWFGHHYEPKDIRVTPDFPVDSNGNPVFAGMDDRSGTQRELWPALMEKAFAQWKGGYGDIEGGNPGSAMAMLTGKDGMEQSGSKATIDQIADALASGKGVTAGTFDNGKGKAAYDNGILYADHVYMVTGVDKQNDTVTLRNPWGTWTPDITMSIGDFNKSFEYMNINPTK